jgi:tetratricopeptide (TPR) repeat protein
MKANAAALELWRKLAAGAPEVAHYQGQVGATLNNLARNLLARKNPAEAARLLEEAVTWQKRARMIDRENGTYRLFLRNHYWNLAEALTQLGKHGQAGRTAVELPALYPDSWNEYVRAANYLSRCALLAAKDGELSEEKRKQVVNGYGERAVTLLRQAVAKGWKNVAALKDPVFEPLRSRDDFQKLLAKLEGKSRQ